MRRSKGIISIPVCSFESDRGTGWKPIFRRHRNAYMDISDEELEAEVRKGWVPRLTGDIGDQVIGRPTREWILKRAIDRFPETHLIGARARYEFLLNELSDRREAAVRYITERHLVRQRLEIAIKDGASQEEVDALRKDLETREEETARVKVDIREFETVIREKAKSLRILKLLDSSE